MIAFVIMFFFPVTQLEVSHTVSRERSVSNASVDRRGGKSQAGKGRKVQPVV